MSVPLVTQGDIEELQLEYPTLDFAHAERQAVLSACGTVDVQAAPGSGKTTLLAAKLSILARRWMYEKRGICVLSHTNVARDEIETRLRESRYGSRLFTHPHFIGTIQSFIHTFISLPLLRSWGVRVRVIDDDEHARISQRRVEASWMLRQLAKAKPHDYAPALVTLRYEGPSLELSCAKGKLPGSSAKSYSDIRDLKAGLLVDGIFRYDDMFAFAQHTLGNFPALGDALRHRFPIVFIDEMQDTSDAQIELLRHAMGSDCIYQRFGDVNQRILRAGDEIAAAFPTGAPLPISTSKRFGAPIASVANSLRIFGPEIVGDATVSDIPVSLFTFTDESVKNVIPVFLDSVRQLVPASEIAKHGVKAVCARKEPAAAKGCGRFLGDYTAAGANRPQSTSERLTNLHSALQAASIARIESRNLANAVNRTRTAMLSLLQDLKWPAVDGVKSWRQLTIAGDEHVVQKANSICERLLRAPVSCETASAWEAVLHFLAVELTALIERPVDVAELFSHAVVGFTGPVVSTASTSSGAPAGDIDVATIASVKGETHAATLVLQSFFNKRYDIPDVLPFLCGTESSLDVKDGKMLRSLHNLFVAATRPRHYLAFAIHSSHLPGDNRNQLVDRGWSIIDVT